MIMTVIITYGYQIEAVRSHSVVRRCCSPRGPRTGPELYPPLLTVALKHRGGYQSAGTLVLCAVLLHACII